MIKFYQELHIVDWRDVVHLSYERVCKFSGKVRRNNYIFTQLVPGIYLGFNPDTKELVRQS